MKRYVNGYMINSSPAQKWPRTEEPPLVYMTKRNMERYTPAEARALAAALNSAADEAEAKQP